MKHIIKNPEPQELRDWKSGNGNYKAGNPSWKTIPRAVKDVVRENLKDEQGHICCYCERFLQAGDYHVEHIKPKGKTGPYWRLLAEYDNLLCSCQAEGTVGDPLHCGRAKDNWYDPVDYVSPLDAGCEVRFSYTYIGGIEGNDQGAVTTIDKLKLDLPKLSALRAGAIEPFLDDSLTVEELAEFVNGYLIEKELNDGRYNQFYTTIKFLFQN